MWIDKNFNGWAWDKNTLVGAGLFILAGWTCEPKVFKLKAGCVMKNRKSHVTQSQAGLG